MNIMNSNLEKLAADAFDYLDRNGMAETNGTWRCDAGYPVFPQCILVVTTSEHFTFLRVILESALTPKKDLIVTLLRLKTDEECTYSVINVGGCEFPTPIPLDAVESVHKEMGLNEVSKFIIRGCRIVVKAPHFIRIPDSRDFENSEDEPITNDYMYQRIKALYAWAEEKNIDGLVSSPAEFGIGTAVSRRKVTVNISAGKVEVIDINIYLWASIFDFEPKRLIGFRRVVADGWDPQDDRLFAAITALDGQETPAGTLPMALNAEGRKLLDNAIESVFLSPRWEKVDRNLISNPEGGIF